MPPNAQKKDKLVEKQDEPPDNNPHHRTINPKRSSLRPGSDAGIDPLPSLSLKPTTPKRGSSTRPRSRNPSQPQSVPIPHSPRPPVLCPSTGRVPAQNGGERKSREARRPASHGGVDYTSAWAKLQHTSGQHSSSYSSGERGRQVDNITRVLAADRAPPPHPHAPVHDQRLHKPAFVPINAVPTFVSHSVPPVVAWPEILHPHQSSSVGSAPLLTPDEEQQRFNRRKRYLKYQKHTLEIAALHSFLVQYLAPLNPLLAAPPPPYRFIGTKFEKCLESSNWMVNWREKKSALPGLVWDVRDRPDVFGEEGIEITAWPYAKPFGLAEHMRGKEMRTRALVGEGEVRRFCGQTVTNPPSSSLVVRVTEHWSIRVTSSVPGRWVSVRESDSDATTDRHSNLTRLQEDVIDGVYTALNAPIHRPDGVPTPPKSPKIYSSSLDGTKAGTATNALPELPATRISTLKDGHYTWAGLRREQSGTVDGPVVRATANGEVDGGTWWLVLRKP